jgi:Lamin Tail Domain
MLSDPVRSPFTFASLIIALLAGGSPAGAAGSAAAAAPVVAFTKIQYDSPGADNRSNASLNAEWIRLTNTTTRTINLRNWTVRDAAGKVYRFIGDYRLGAGRNVYLHTGKGTNGRPDTQHRYWQSGNYIWNNTGDTATLRNAANATIDSCSWRRNGGVTSC